MTGVTEGSTGDRPTLVTAAIWLSVVATVTSVVVGLTRLFITPPPQVDGRQVSHWAMEATAVLVVTFAAFNLMLLWLMTHRQRWAYIVYLVLVLPGIATLPFTARHELTASVPTSLYFVVHTVVEIVSVVLLLTASSRVWFAAPTPSDLHV